ncbi:MAG TPA: hemerythrin domain-containing protein [Blastocatellia bacterium]|nr:hemerythrin domain-containing protein [Blastocatellia bacterium]
MNAIELLKEDHQEVMRFIEELEGADDEAGTDPTDTETYNKLAQALKLHTRMEEEVFYPVMEGFSETREMIREAYKEHDQVDHLLAQLSTMAPNEEEFQDVLAELRDSIEHHVEEEEGELFPKAEELCGQERLNEMARQMEKMKNSRTVAATMRQRK